MLVRVGIVAAVALVLTCFWLHYNWGAAYAAEGDKTRAIASATQAITLNPNFAQAYTNRGVARAALGDRKGAIKDFTEAIKLDPHHVTAYYNRGIAHAAEGDKKGAIKDYQKAADLYQQQGKTSDSQD